MLKRSYCLTALIAASTTLVAVLARSQPFVPINPIAPQTTSEQRVSPSMPVCYIQLENNQLRDLRRLCGKKTTNPVPSRSVQRPGLQLDPDSEDDDSDAPPRARTTPQPPPTSPPAPQPTPTQSVPQPAASPASGLPDRPTTIQLPPASPAISAPSTPNPLAPNPLAIEEVKPSRD